MFKLVNIADGSIGFIDISMVISMTEHSEKKLYCIFLGNGIGFTVLEDSYRKVEKIIVDGMGEEDGTRNDKS